MICRRDTKSLATKPQRHEVFLCPACLTADADTYGINFADYTDGGMVSQLKVYYEPA